MTSPRQSSSRQSSPRNSASLRDEERDTLLIHSPPTSPRTGAIWQIVAFTIVGLFIALGSAAFAYTLRGHVSKEFIHVPLPGLRDPSLLKYFGGMGPYIGLEYPPPPGQCRVSQVHMMARHGERYPTRHVGETMASFASNISVGGFRDSLAFLNTWNLSDWIYAPESQLEQETLTGPAAGSTHMFTLGSQFRSRYGDLWDFRSQGPVKVWSSDSTRVIHSARYFASAFFGVDTPTQVEVIPETEERFGNSLTTTDSCPAFKRSEYNASYGFTVAAQTYQETFLPKVITRLNKMSTQYRFTAVDVLSMQQICPYQLNAMGQSPFCDVFTTHEWKDFNYARDLATYYASGPGNPFGATLGQPWVNAVLNLMTRNTSNVYFSFSHDTDIVPIIPALGITPDKPLPWEKYADRVFWTSSVVPMGGHIVVERLHCPDPHVRVLVNGRLQSMSWDESGIYPLNSFIARVRGQWNETFCEACGNVDCVDDIDFFE